MNAALILIPMLVLAAPPSGRPPTGPLERYEPRLYDIKYEVVISTDIPFDGRPAGDPRYPIDVQSGGILELEDTPIVMPLVFHGSYHWIQGDSVTPELWLGNHPDRTLPERFRIEEGLPHHGHLGVIPIVSFRGYTVRWNIAYRVQSFSSRLNEAGAASIPWPREWPQEVADGLTPQMFIESDDELFAATVARVSEGNLRLVPPYLAAKDLVRYCVNELQISGDGLRRGRLRMLHGLEIKGASQTARDGRGSPNDLVCVCVAMLRAAGIPARPVIGIHESDEGRDELVTWAEFHLPKCGWIPFDPNEMRGKAIANRDIRQTWPGFGTLKDLNRRIPLAYHFIPPKTVQSPQYPAVWGWDPRPSGAPSTEQRIDISIVSRGRGKEDPQ